MEEIQRVAQMPDEDLSNFLNNEDEYEYEYDVATKSPEYQLLQNRGQSNDQMKRSQSTSPKKRRRKKRNNIPQPSGKDKILEHVHD